MKLSKIIKGIKSKEIINFEDFEIDCLTHFSKDCIKNSIFFCIDGLSESGSKYVGESINLGAKVIVTEKVVEGCKNVTQIVVNNVRVVMSIMAKNFYNKSDEKLQKIAIVGTNGKTTTCNIIATILKDCDKKIGIIGTNGVYINGEWLPLNMTTPDPIELHYIFGQMVYFGVEVVIMEVSAHAIYYDKIYGIKFDVGVFTNISNEHLDFFKNMQNYAEVKKSIFNKLYIKEGVCNTDDSLGVEIAKQADVPVVSYGINNPANIFAVNIKISIDGTEFVANINDEVECVKTGLVGEYNVYNILASIACVKLFGVDTKSIIRSLKNIKCVDGRFMVFERDKNRKIIVDFAHTPDGFEKVLSLIKKLRKGKLTVLFGCVGYSDTYKRSLMGKVASEYCDEIILTTDNIGFENFNKMCSDVMELIDKSKVICMQEDRKKAVTFAFERMKKNDTLILLGKGNEKYQVVKDNKLPYCEIDVIKNLLLGDKD